MAQRAETAVAEYSPTSCVWAVSGNVLKLCLDSGIVSPLRLRWVKGVRVFRCNLPPALLAEWPGSFTCHCGNMGVKRTPNKSQHTQLTLEKKILPPLLPGFELATFRSRVRRSHQQAPGWLSITLPIHSLNKDLCNNLRYNSVTLLGQACVHYCRAAA